MIKTTDDLIQKWREIGPAAWSEGLYGWITEENRPVTLLLWQKAILDAYNQHRESVTILAISNIKKTGKTFLDALLTTWRWLSLPGQHFCLGNDMDQSLSRQFAMISEMVARHPYLRDHVKVTRNELIFLPTDSRLTTLSVDAAGNAGANHLTASHTEAWGIIYESGIRAYEELTPPPGMKYGLPAMRILDSYAGFEGESVTWHTIVDRGLAGKRISKDWPIYQNGGLLLFHMEGEQARERCFRGAPAEAKAYYGDQQTTLRPNAFTRMHSNQRTSGESAFLPEGAWAACYSPEVRPVTTNDKIKMVLGADASTTRDLTALVGIHHNDATNTDDVGLVRLWKPQKGFLRFGKPTIDLDETIGQAVLDLHAAGQVAAVVCDPYQLHSLMLRWEKAGIKVIELAQNAGRVESDQGLYDAVIGRTIRHFNHPDLNEHIKHAVAIETPRGIRLAKEKTSLKIDAAVALSMARYASLESQRHRLGTVSVVKDPFETMPFYGDNWTFDAERGWYQEYITTPAQINFVQPIIRDPRRDQAVDQFWKSIKEK